MGDPLPRHRVLDAGSADDAGDCHNVKSTKRSALWLAHPCAVGAVEAKRPAEALLEAAHVLGPFDVLVGHSMGGGAALFAVAEGLRVVRVVTFAAPASIDEVLARFSSFIGLPDPARRALRARVVSVVGRRPEEVDVGSYAGRVTIPVLVIHDVNDREVPFSDAQQLLRHLPNARLLETRGLGHGWIVRDTGVARDVAAWLAATRSSADSPAA